MEAHTYGGSPAAEVLAKMLTEKYPNLQHKVGAYWSDYTHTMKELDIDSGLTSSVKENLRDLFHHSMVKTVEESGMPDEVRSFLRNIMVKRWRQTKITW